MIYLKEFATQAAYNDAKEGLLTPNVSLITDGGEVKYKGGSTPTNATVTCVFDVSGGELYFGETFIEEVQSMTFDGESIDVTSAITNVDGVHTIVFTLKPNGVIANDALGDNAYLTSLNIQGNTSIQDGQGGGPYAFGNCSSLTSVTIGTGVTFIGERAFEGCESLESIEIPNATIGTWAFTNCSSLTSVTFGTGVTTIGNGAFQNTSIESIEIPNANIGEAAFGGCTSLTSVTFGTGVTTIGEAAFSSCTSITSIVIPNNVTSIGNNAFYDCQGITSLTIGDGVTSIPGNSFNNCESLKEISIGNGVTTIGNGAFRDSERLTSVTFGTNVQTIGNNAFAEFSMFIPRFYGTTAPTIQSNTFSYVENMYVPTGSTGYEAWKTNYSDAFGECNIIYF